MHPNPRLRHHCFANSFGHQPLAPRNGWLIRPNPGVCGLTPHTSTCSLMQQQQHACHAERSTTRARACPHHDRPPRAAPRCQQRARRPTAAHAPGHAPCPWHTMRPCATPINSTPKCAIHTQSTSLHCSSRCLASLGQIRFRSSRSPCRTAISASSAWDSGGQASTDGDGITPSPYQSSTVKQPAALGRLATAAQEFIMSSLAPLITWVTLYRDIIQRVLLSVAMLAVFRCGLYIPLPGLDFGLLPSQPAFSEGERLVRALYGQARALPASLFELGISPYINASILITLVLAMPEQLVSWGPLNRLREARKEGRAGQAYITSILNWLALGFSVYFALVKAVELRPYAVAPGPGYLPLTAMSLVAGSAIIQHCASVITANGIGNGSSLVICCGIITEYAEALHAVISRLEAGAIAPSLLLSLGGTYLALALAAVYISRTELRLPVLQYSRGSTGPPNMEGPAAPGQDSDMVMFSNARRMAEQRMAHRVARAEYFPIPINGNGMMSIILAGAFWYFMLPTGAQFLGLTGVVNTLLSIQASWAGLLVYALLVFAVEFLPLGGINPKDVAEYFNAMNVGIKGVVPGEPTEQHVQRQLLLCKFWGGLALGCLAVVAHVFDAACMSALGASLSATSLLIIVGTVIQSSRQVESLLEAPQLNSQLQKEQGLIKSLANL